jgi:hypothetical protein
MDFFYSGLPNRNVLFYGDPERRPGKSAGHKTAHRQGANPISFFKNNIWWLMRLFFIFISQIGIETNTFIYSIFLLGSCMVVWT